MILTDIRQLIYNAFFAHPLVVQEIGCTRLPNIGGGLSTTFSPTVFGQVHVNEDIAVSGANVAIRPTDLDGGTHLASFSQLYIATNKDLSQRQEEYVGIIINDIVKGICDFPIELHVVPTEYSWHADSTGYSGGGYQMDIQNVVIDGKSFNIGRLEVAQLNDYNTSGTIEGRPAHLIVFGIDRIVNLIQICRSFHAGTEVDFTDRQALYNFSPTEDRWHEEFYNRMSRVPLDAQKILEKITRGFNTLKDSLESGDLNFKVFSGLGRLNTLMECAYSANIITSDYRNEFIRNARKMYTVFAKDIRENPDRFMQSVHRLTQKATLPGQTGIPDPVTDALEFVPEIAELFPLQAPLPFQNIEMMVPPENMESIYLEHEFGAPPYDCASPSYINKVIQLNNLISADFARPIQDRLSDFGLIHTRIGTLKDRLTAKTEALNFMSANHFIPAEVNVEHVAELIKLYETEFTYRTPKLHPFMHGLCVPAQLAQEEHIQSSVIMDLTMLHSPKIGGEGVASLNPELLTALAVNNLVEACLYYAKTDKSPGSNDPDGIKPKIETAVNAMQALGINGDDILEVYKNIVEKSKLCKSSNKFDDGSYVQKRIITACVPS